MTWGKGIAIVSGGLDSSIMLLWLAQLGAVDSAVFFDYGQRSAEEQWRNAQHHAKEADVGIIKVRLPMPTVHGGVYEHGFVPQVTDNADGEIDLEGDELAEWRREQWSFIEARNSIFLLWAAGLASERSLSRVYVGFQEETESGSQGEDNDITLPFVEAVNALLTFGAVTRPVKVVAPFLELGLNKTAICELGARLHVDVAMTYSCEFYPPCNVCGSCTRRARATDRSA